MKKITSFVAVALFAVTTWAQAPQKFNYQTVVRNSSNALVTGTNVGFRISILQGSASGSAVYQETQSVTTNANGLATLVIGNGTVVSGSMAGIDWSANSYYIKSEVAPAGGTNYTITNISQLLSVPYALYAKTAGSTSGAYNPWANYIIVEEVQPNGTDGGTTPSTALFTRNLNTLRQNVGTAFTFNPTGNSITLNENGVYYLDASAVSYASSRNSLFVENVVTNQMLLQGVTNYFDPTGNVAGISTVKGIITVTNAPVSIRLRHYTTVGHSPNGAGPNLNLANYPNVYSSCQIQKIKD